MHIDERVKGVKGNMTDLITVAIALYNNENVVGRCIESVLSQTYHNIEILIIDDGSTDQSFSIANKYKDSRIRLIKKENGGLSTVRQMCLDIARGEFISFIDADDYINPTYVSNLYTQIKESGADICVCSTQFIEDKSNRIMEDLTKAYSVKDEHVVKISDELLADSYYYTLCKYFMCDSWNKMYRTRFLKETHNVFNTTKGLNGTDLAYNHKLLLYNPLICGWRKKEYIHIIYSKSAVHRKDKKLINSVIEYIDQIICEAKKLGKYNTLQSQISSVYIAALRDVFQDIYREHIDDTFQIKKSFSGIIVEHKKFIEDKELELNFLQPTKSLSLFAILLKLNNSLFLLLYFMYRTGKVHRI